MRKSKKLSNPFSTGGGGVHFEAHVQASFVTLMLTCGHAPCLPCWPIAEIKLQGKIDGFDTDDLVVVVENVNSQERRKLLAQVKHSIAITQGSALFGEVMQAAWNDFNNPKVFTKDKDIIALITGPLSATDAHNVKWLLDQARHTKNVDEFFRNVQQANFSPPKSAEKLEVIQHHVKAANSGNDVSRDELYDFMNHFHLLGYDLGNEPGVALSLLHSHISQFQQQSPQWVWSRIVDIVQTWNQDGGTITVSKLPDDLLDAFKQKAAAEFPEGLKLVREKPKTDWTQHPDASYLALLILIGSWQEKNQCDLEVMARFLGISYDEWLKKAREIIHFPDSPLSLKNGVWKVVNRAELWSQLGSRILDENLDTFKSLAVSVMKEPDPVFGLPANERYAAKMRSKTLKYSHVLRQGIADGLAILGSQSDTCSNCSFGKAEETSILAIREILNDADWFIWGSLNSFLPSLAEAAPKEFVGTVEKTLRLAPCPFDELFSRKDVGIIGGNYLYGLLLALEGLAWDEQYLVRICVVLAELASHDSKGQWSNSPSGSLATILLPWLPQTLASVDKRQVAIRTILRERPEIAWNLIIRLLPGQHRISSGSHKPSWRKTIPDDWEKGVTNHEYWQQTSFLAEVAITAAGQDSARLAALVSHFDDLPQPAFDQLLQVLASQTVTEIPEAQRLLIWESLRKLTSRHRRFFDAKWALPGELIIRIEQVTEQLAPKNPVNLYRHLFNGQNFDLYDENDDWEMQQKNLDIQRETAVFEIFKQTGVEGVIKFSESVSSPSQLGYSLGMISNAEVEMFLLPRFLDSPNEKHKALVNGFVWRKYDLKDWEWCDAINKSDWTPVQTGQFLACLPFVNEAWWRASEWLNKYEGEYWSRAVINACKANSDYAIAVDKLIEYDRPHAAIQCLCELRHTKREINSNQCARALLAAAPSNEHDDIDEHHIIELIKLLQADSSVNQDDLFKIEWKYLSLFYNYKDASPQHLENRLANDPEFFSEVIRLIYRSKHENRPSQEANEASKAIASNAWSLLHDWKTPPGTQKDGSFSEKVFSEWLQKVKALCSESAHLDVAFINVGAVLIHTPPAPDGLWICRTVAAALNDCEADELREGFRTGTYNSRGVYYVDPAGKPERKLAENFRNKAEEVENAGFQRFAATLRELADGYDRDAERIIAEHERDDK